MLKTLTRIARIPLPLALAAGAVAALVPLAATAQNAPPRDPAYAAARAAGQVGEQPDGYLGFPVPPSDEVRAMARKINIERRDLYTRKAAEQGTTVQSYAMTTGCLLIARTAPGEKYQAPDGSWQTRTSAPPVRDGRCPPA